MCTMKQASFSPYSKTEIEQVLASLNMQILRMAAHLFKTLKRWKHQEMSEMFFSIFQIEVFQLLFVFEDIFPIVSSAFPYDVNGSYEKVGYIFVGFLS